MRVNPVKIIPCTSIATFRSTSWVSIKMRPTLPDIKRNNDTNRKYENNRLTLNFNEFNWMLLYIKIFNSNKNT